MCPPEGRASRKVVRPVAPTLFPAPEAGLARVLDRLPALAWMVDARGDLQSAHGALLLEVAAAEVQKDKADLDAADATASKCTIAAPFSGVTVEQKAREFQYTTPGQALLDILDDHALEVELIVPSRWLSWLKPGYTFQVRIDETDKSYPAKVTRLGGRVDPVSQSIKVIGEIVGAAPELMAGMSGRATMAPP